MYNLKQEVAIILRVIYLIYGLYDILLPHYTIKSITYDTLVLYYTPVIKLLYIQYLHFAHGDIDNLIIFKCYRGSYRWNSDQIELLVFKVFSDSYRSLKTDEKKYRKNIFIKS